LAKIRAIRVKVFSVSMFIHGSIESLRPRFLIGRDCSGEADKSYKFGGAGVYPVKTWQMENL
jgi:hypothetical protein